jgi:hypothetical protein
MKTKILNSFAEALRDRRRSSLEENYLRAVSRGRQGAIARNKWSIQRLGERDVGSVIRGPIVAQLPNTGSQNVVRVAVYT